MGGAGPLHGILYLLIRTELCGKTLKHWLEHHKKRKRRRLLIYFEQVSALTLHSMYRSGQTSLTGRNHAELCSLIYNTVYIYVAISIDLFHTGHCPVDQLDSRFFNTEMVI